MKKLNMQTKDLTDENIEEIAKLFPNVITESKDEEGNIVKKVDFDLLKQSLSKDIVEGGEERYRLDWPGKRASLLKANTPLKDLLGEARTLRPVPEDSKDFENTENLYIEGDNFEVLKLLQESYLGKVKMIYIDPPYNTGKDFVYKDNFKQSKDQYEEEIGVENEEGGKLFKNTDSNGRFHSDWLSMMYERLIIARDFLRDDGVIFISIDDNEVHNLRKICDEIFGEENFVGEIIRKTKSMTGDKDTGFNLQHENLILYSKSIEEIKLRGEEKKYKSYKNPDDDPKGNWTSADPSAKSGSESTFFEIKNPNTGQVDLPPQGRYWAFSKSTFKKYIDSGRIRFREIHEANRRGFVFKRYKSELNSRFKPVNSLFAILNKFMNQKGTKELHELFKKDIFDNPKPTIYLNKIIRYSTNSNDIILDFFSGSATTAHAVMKLNAEDMGNRKFIMVQLPEQTDEDSEAYKAGYKNICEIGKERIRRAGEKIKKEELEKLEKELADIEKEMKQKKLVGSEEMENKKQELEEKKKHIENLDIGFRVYKTDSTNMKDVYYHPEELEQKSLEDLISNIKEDRKAEDLLTQVMLDLGLTLDLPVEEKEMEGNKVFIVQQNALVACFDKDINFEIVEEIAKFEPLKVVFRDGSFKEDKDRINMETKFRELSPETEVGVV